MQNSHGELRMEKSCKESYRNFCSAGSQSGRRDERTYADLSCDRKDFNRSEYLKQNNSYGETWLILYEQEMI